MKLRLVLLFAGAVVGGIGGMVALRTKVPTLGKAVIELRVPRATIAIDGEPNDPGWEKAARTGAFLPARPFSEARFVRGDGKLYALLYAADEDIRSDSDSFHLEFAGRAFDVSPLSSSVESAHDIDGTIDDAHDDDEEWVMEVAIPLATLGVGDTAGTRIPFFVKRCDTPRGSKRVCGESGGVLVLE